MIRKNVLHSIFVVIALLMLLTGCESKKEVKAGCKVYKKLPSDIMKSVEVNYDDKVKLLGVSAYKLSDKQLKLIYYWKQLDNLKDHNTVFVHITNNAGKVIMQNDHDFCTDMTIEKLNDYFAVETYLVNIPETAIGQDVEIKIGIYSKELKSRLKITEAPGISVDDKHTRAIILKLKT